MCDSGEPKGERAGPRDCERMGGVSKGGETIFESWLQGNISDIDMSNSLTIVIQPEKRTFWDCAASFRVGGAKDECAKEIFGAGRGGGGGAGGMPVDFYSISLK